LVVLVGKEQKTNKGQRDGEGRGWGRKEGEREGKT